MSDRRAPMSTERRTACVLLVSLLLVACGDGAAPPETEQPRESAVSDAPRIAVETSTAHPDVVLPFRASGFTPGSAVEVGIGPPHSEYSVIAEYAADERGVVAAGVELGEWVDAGSTYVLVATTPTRSSKAVSDPFVVGKAGDPIRVRGTLTDEGAECPALRGEFGALYTLADGELDHPTGTQLVVEGTIAEMSICMQGTTIEVSSIERYE